MLFKLLSKPARRQVRRLSPSKMTEAAVDKKENVKKKKVTVGGFEVFRHFFGVTPRNSTFTYFDWFTP